jgi:hypothetical protein
MAVWDSVGASENQKVSKKKKKTKKTNLGAPGSPYDGSPPRSSPWGRSWLFGMASEPKVSQKKWLFGTASTSVRIKKGSQKNEKKHIWAHLAARTTVPETKETE